MGLIITNQGADYSSLGLGFTDWVTEFLYRSNITDANQKAAVRTLYNSAVSAGIWSKLYGVCFFPGSTAATQKNIFREDKGVLTFQGATIHTAAGFQPNTVTTGTAYADTGYALPAGLINTFSFGVFNATAETQSGPRYLMGVSGSAAGGANADGDYILELARYWNGNAITLGSLTQYGSGTTARAFTLAGSYDTTKVGFLQLSKNGTAYNLLDNGAVIATITATNLFNVRGGDNRTLVIGAQRQQSGLTANVSTCVQKFAYWGALSLAESQTWNTIVQTFLTSFGR